MSNKDKFEWFGKHKILSAILIIVAIPIVLGMYAGALEGINGNKTKPVTLASATKSTSTTTSASTPASKPTKTAAATPSTPTTTTTAAPAKTSTPATTKAAPAAPKVLLNLSGNGIENSAPFLVTESQLTVTYSYDCSADGGSGNFIADLLYGDQSSLNSDDQSIANALSSGATNVTTTIYPADPGNDYYLSVNSECSWTVTVSS